MIADSLTQLVPDDTALVVCCNNQVVDRLGYLKVLLTRFPGPIPVYLRKADSHKVVLADRKYWCDGSPELIDEVKRLFGEEAVSTSLANGE